MSVIHNDLLLTGDDGYNLTNSVRLRSSASAYLTRTPSSSPTDSKKYTYSTWIKKSKVATANQFIYGCGSSGSDETYFGFNSSDKFEYLEYTSGAYQVNVSTTAVYRDPSAWYHLVLVFDTTQATSSDRVKLYINGVQQTLSGTFPSLNYATSNVNSTDVQNINRLPTSGGLNFDGYYAETIMVDGQALTPSSFGQTSSTTGAWQPKKYTGTYGTNGFYLPFNLTSETYDIEYLVVAGGGGGGYDIGGGGGAGGYVSTSATVIPFNTYTATVGGGGSGSTSQSSAGGNGSNSVFGSTTAIGGGGGGSRNNNSARGNDGGSGGGGSYNSGSAGSGTSGQGNNGGVGSGGGAAGGGGKGATGSNGNGGGAGGNGGNGSAWLNGTTYAGGGGGGGQFGTAGSGGSGGGGNGGTINTSNNTAGGTNTGGGGGGSGSSFGINGSSGGSGIVIVRYAGSQRGTGGTVTSAGGYTYHTFTSSGTYTA